MPDRAGSRTPQAPREAGREGADFCRVLSEDRRADALIRASKIGGTAVCT